MVRYYFIFIAIFLLSASCSDSKIIPEKDMVKILRQVYLTDGVIAASDARPRLMNDSIDYYEPIIESFGYTHDQFDSSIKYYSRNTELFDAILDAVILELSKMEEPLIEEAAKADSIASSVDDTLPNLWPFKPNWDMSKDYRKNSSLSFSIPVKGLGQYTIKYSAKVSFKDQSAKPRMNIYFSRSDTSRTSEQFNPVVQNYIKDDSLRTFTHTLTLTDSKVTHFKGELYAHDDDNISNRHRAIFSNITVEFKPVVSDSLRVKPMRIKHQLTKPKLRRANATKLQHAER